MPPMLLSYEEALARILKAVEPVHRPGENIPLIQGGPIRVLAKPLVASAGHPRFDNSAVDGYGIHQADLNRVGVHLPIALTAATGTPVPDNLLPGCSARVLTGAAVPEGVAAVVMQEDVRIESGSCVLSEPVSVGANIRRAGADFSTGEVLVEAGTPLTAGVAGILASQGETRPAVTALPKCIIIATGDEIVSPDATPGPGQLRDSIGPMLVRAASSIVIAYSNYVCDDAARLEETLSVSAAHADAIFVAGGASVGDRDFTAKVVDKLGSVEFHGITIRPGKPLLFGHVRGKPVIGLPGNPASAYVCFRLFAQPLLRRLGGWQNPQNTWFPITFGATHAAEAREVFARVAIDNGRAMPIFEQQSFGIKSLGAAHALARLPAGRDVSPGDIVQATLLDSH